ncbi:MAG TPA: methanogenesis marker 3 protein, partial [Methanothrix sp.]|nr:methanogenesis marker 3 protein [Methanothrix sp.]
PGERITIKVRPERIMLLGKSLKDALSQMQSKGIQVRAEGYQGEDAVVVKQEPGATMAILKGKNVVLHSMPSSRLVAVKLYSDQAPKTLDYFRHVTGLKERPLGPLPVFFVYENTLLFKPDVDATSYKELLPENKPEGPVPAGSIAVSNTVSKKMGMVGVKLAEDKRYGPSGEKFEATNIIGRVLEPEKLRDVKEGETVYIMEVR